MKRCYMYLSPDLGYGVLLLYVAAISNAIKIIYKSNALELKEVGLR